MTSDDIITCVPGTYSLDMFIVSVMCITVIVQTNVCSKLEYVLYLFLLRYFFVRISVLPKLCKVLQTLDTTVIFII